MPSAERRPTRRVLRPAGLTTACGAWSHVLVVDAPGGGTLIFVAGQTALAADGTVVGTGDFAAQFERTYANLGVALAAAGAGYADIASLRTFLTRDDDVERFVALRDARHRLLFPAGDNPPNTLLVVRRLALPELLIEIEAIAAV